MGFTSTSAARPVLDARSVHDACVEDKHIAVLCGGREIQKLAGPCFVFQKSAQLRAGPPRPGAFWQGDDVQQLFRAVLVLAQIRAAQQERADLACRARGLFDARFHQRLVMWGMFRRGAWREASRSSMRRAGRNLLSTMAAH